MSESLFKKVGGLKLTKLIKKETPTHLSFCEFRRNFSAFLKGNVRNFQKLKQYKYLIKYCILQKRLCLKIYFFVFLANFIFVVSHLEIHPALYLNTWKVMTSWQSKRNIRSIFVY